jgi:hypothetical protein
VRWGGRPDDSQRKERKGEKEKGTDLFKKERKGREKGTDLFKRHTQQRRIDLLTTNTDYFFRYD